jgi:hypothetical protein
MVARCLFVRGYFRVESVIRQSVAKHEEEQIAANAASASGDGDGDRQDDDRGDAHAETDALQLQLNDLSCSIASGCGYALLHSLFLYGTLLASESGEANSYDEGSYSGGGGAPDTAARCTSRVAVSQVSLSFPPSHLFLFFRFVLPRGREMRDVSLPSDLYMETLPDLTRIFPETKNARVILISK